MYEGKKRGDGFFKSVGLGEEDSSRAYKKIIMYLSMSTHTGMEYYMGLPFYEVMEFAEIAKEVAEEIG